MASNRFQLPVGAKFSASSPLMNESTVLPGIRKRHLAPSGKCAVIRVFSGSLQLVWEDTGEKINVDADHPALVEAERFHHVELNGPVQFRVDFYDVGAKEKPEYAGAERPGEAFVH